MGKPGLVNLIDFDIAMQVYFIPPYYPNQIGLIQYVVSSASATQNPNRTQRKAANAFLRIDLNWLKVPLKMNRASDALIDGFE